MDKAEHDLSMSLVSLRSSKSSGGFSPDKSGALPSIKTPKHNDSKDGGYAPSLFRFQRRLSSVQLLPLGPHPKILLTHSGLAVRCTVVIHNNTVTTPECLLGIIVKIANDVHVSVV
eukprot:7346251-Pyramimonas_sp.AAC.2